MTQNGNSRPGAELMSKKKGLKRKKEVGKEGRERNEGNGLNTK
jgi:hypothetical protein